jgi:UDP-glucose 4-epimerase
MRGPRNVMVTGASTPIGERLCRALLDDSRVDRVLAITAEPPDDFPVAERGRLDVRQVDLARSRRVRALLFGPARDAEIDTVIHLAMHRSAADRGRRVHQFNVEALRAIIQLAERHPTIQRLVVRSAAEVYKVSNDLPTLIGEDHPLNLHGNPPQWVRDRVEADVTACGRMGLSPLQIVVLRMAEALAPGTGSQLYDYLESPVCLRPMGYDPMINVLTIEDSVAALQKALHSDAQGVFNVPGADTLPLSTCIRSYGRIGIAIPSHALAPLYRWRARLRGHDFRYGMNARRFHYSTILDGARAREVLGFVPSHPVEWPIDDAEDASA